VRFRSSSLLTRFSFFDYIEIRRVIFSYLMIIVEDLCDMLIYVDIDEFELF